MDLYIYIYITNSKDFSEVGPSYISLLSIHSVQSSLPQQNICYMCKYTYTNKNT